MHITVCILYRNVYTLYMQHIYNLEVHMSTSGMVIHYTGWGCQSPNLQEIHYFKWEFCVWFAWFKFVQHFLEHNASVK